MKVPLGWLAEWIDLPASVEELEERLTLGGLEIEGIEKTGPDLSGVIVGHVLERQPHPDADRLSVCRVDVGGEEPVGIVCGAPNVRDDLRVAVVRPGSTLPDGTRLKKTKIRGVVSQGMICSARELGLGDDHDGILELPGTPEPGTPLHQVLAAGDTVVDFEITPNRGDWASMLGMAREVRTHFGGELRWPVLEPPETGPQASGAVRVSIEDAGGCHLYAARLVRGVRVGPSPAWLQERLESVGLRPINNVVDVTNLVLLELGQPLHAFDLSTLSGGEIRVRAASAGEKIVTLDGQSRELETGDLVIADAERAVAVAGVMGGAETEVRESTRDVLIESAHFDAVRVRRTARRLGLRTDASYRFERGVDPGGVGRAADRCALLLAELAGGEVARGRVEVRGTSFEHCDAIRLDPSHPSRLLGVEISRDDVIDCLQRVDVGAVAADGDILCCSIPSWRSDLRIPEDLVEEVGRVWGYDRVPEMLPAAPLLPVAIPSHRRVAARARDGLCSAGLLEVRSVPMSPVDDPDGLRLEPDDPRRATVRLLNPIVETEPELRTHLLPGLLRAVRRNLARQVEQVRLFEVGRAFLARPGELPAEPEAAVAVLAGAARATLWGGDPPPLFFQARGVAERVLGELGQTSTLRAGGDAPWLHPGAQAELLVGKRPVGRVGELHPGVAAHHGIGVPCAVVELDLDAIDALGSSQARFVGVSAYPASRRDMAVILAADQPAGDVLDAIRTAGGKLLADVELFDRYEGEGIPDGRVSLAFRLTFQHLDRTLTDDEVGKTAAKIVRMLEHRFGGELR